MLEALRNEMNRTCTENGAVTLESSGSDCLDLFATIGALRHATDDEIVRRFVRAYAEDADMAMKLLFYARDVRGGLGERRVFRVILRYLAENEPASVLRNLSAVAEFGRFDDLLSLLGTPCEGAMLSVIASQLKADTEVLACGGAPSLLAKWLPSVNASSTETVRQAKTVARYLNMSDAEYRKTLTALRARLRIIENNLRERDYSFDYEKQPSRALFKYRRAFARNDGERYEAFLQAAAEGKATLHADNVAPYELTELCLNRRRWNGNNYTMALSEEEKHAINATWAAMPDFGSNENALAVVDTSGSMYWARKPSPASVAFSLGLYLAEHNRGCFRNTFIEFSARPRLIELKGDTFVDRLRYASSFNEVSNTDLEAVFDVILCAALRNHLPQSELPAKLVILSDMEFDACMANASLSNFENARANYAARGYKLPQVVFWNVASRNRQQPVRMNEQGVVLVSGVTPRLFAMVAGELISPYALMREILDSERYAMIAA